MGLLDKWKDVLGFGKKKEETQEKQETKKKKKKLSNVEKFRKIENIHKVKLPPVVDSGNTSENRKKHRRKLLEEAK